MLLKRIPYFLICFLVLKLVPLHSETVVTLDEINMPHCMDIFEDDLYILDGGTVFVYRAGSGRFLRKFGRKGNGPGETQHFPVRGNMIFVNQEGVYIDARNKIVLFSHLGKLINEYKKPYQHFYVFPCHHRWVTLSRIPVKQGLQLCVTLCDQQFKIIERLGSKSVINHQRGFALFPDAFNFCVAEDMFFAEFSEDGFLIKGYDPEGKLVVKIEKEIKRNKVTPGDIRYVWEEIANDPETKLMGGMASFRQKIKYTIPQFLPLIKNISFNSGFLFVKTFKRQDYSYLYFIFYQNGELLGNIDLPTGTTDNLDDQLTGRLDRYYGFCGDYYYYLKEDQEREIWQVHRLNWRNKILDRSKNRKGFIAMID